MNMIEYKKKYPDFDQVLKNRQMVLKGSKEGPEMISEVDVTKDYIENSVIRIIMIKLGYVIIYIGRWIQPSYWKCNRCLKIVGYSSSLFCKCNGTMKYKGE